MSSENQWFHVWIFLNILIGIMNTQHSSREGLYITIHLYNWSARPKHLNPGVCKRLFNFGSKACSPIE